MFVKLSGTIYRCGHLEETNERLRKEADEARKLAESERCKVNALCDEKKQLERSTQVSFFLYLSCVQFRLLTCISLFRCRLTSVLFDH